MPNTDAWPLTPGAGRSCMVDHDLTAPDTTANTDAQVIKLLGGKSQTVTGLVGSTYVDGGSTSADTTALMVDQRSLAKKFTANPTISTSAYVAGYCVGGLLTFTTVNRASAGSILIQSASLTDKSKQSAVIDLIVFDTNPTNSTFTDHAALNIVAADLPFIAGVVTFGGWSNFSATGVSSIPSIGLEVNVAATSLYAVMCVRTAPTFAGTTDLALKLNVLQD